MRRLARRPLLTATAGVLVAGCLDDGSDGDDGRTDSPPAGDDSEPPGGDDSELSGADDAEPPGADDSSSSEPTDRTLPTSATVDGCPAYDVDRLVAFHEIDPEETAIYLEPSSDATDENEEVTFSLVNESGLEFSHNRYRWSLHKRVDDAWYFVAPSEWVDPLHGLPDGERYDWDLRVDNDGIEEGESIGGFGATDRDPIAGLGGGEYAFGTQGWFRDDRFEGDVGFCARFTLETDALELTPTDAVVDTEWDDDVLVATSDRGDPGRDSTRLGAYELVRTDDAEGTPMITETVLRNDQLRDVVALAREHDADRVRLEEYDGTYPIFGSREDGYYEYDGETYEILTRELESEQPDP